MKYRNQKIRGKKRKNFEYNKFYENHFFVFCNFLNISLAFILKSRLIFFFFSNFIHL